MDITKRIFFKAVDVRVNNMDWNHDGKIDCKDCAFYNNVVEPGLKKNENKVSINDSNKNTSTSSFTDRNVKGVGLFIGICIFYFIIKLLGA